MSFFARFSTISFGAILSLVATPSRAESALARYIGASSCATASCHGGAGDQRDQWVRWNAKDVHRRSGATLTMARSVQIGAAAGIRDVADDARCTVCHAPFAGVPTAQRIGPLDRGDGVSCETCHGPAEPWIRAHTRTAKDGYTHSDKVAAGLRDLRNPYVRANTCVACHENVDRELLKAGHPELIFELDGQTAAEPRHWMERTGWDGGRAWLVGQAVALREVSWQLARPGQSDSRLVARQAGLLWVVQRASRAIGQNTFVSLAVQSSADKTRAAADDLAKDVASRPWAPGLTAAVLKQLTSAAEDLRDAGTPAEIQARRGERLVLALDRLLAASDRDLETRLDAEMKELFRLAQSLPDFDPAKFAAALEKFAAKL